MELPLRLKITRITEYGIALGTILKGRRKDNSRYPYEVYWPREQRYCQMSESEVEKVNV